MPEWSMVICTLNRFEVLKQALRTTLWQTCLPRQIVIVDSSADWQRCRDEILQTLGRQEPSIEWIYIGSDQRSLTHQRNLGLALCRSEIIFWFDDDTFLYPDCAERILGVYERDTAREIGGVSAGLREINPLASIAEEGAVASLAKTGRSYEGLTEFIYSFWYPEQLFVPYDGQFHKRIPAWLREDPSLMAVSVFHGCRMTFRAAAVREVGGCEEALVRHCFGEDIDISYRVSRRHALVVAMDAAVHHAVTPGARAGRIAQSTLVLLNSAALYMLHETEGRSRPVVLYGFLAKRLLVETLRDLAKPWRGFPNVRGVLGAFHRLPALIHKSREELRRDYPAVQLGLVGR